jgi:hypothetical protein
MHCLAGKSLSRVIRAKVVENSFGYDLSFLLFFMDHARFSGDGCIKKRGISLCITIVPKVVTTELGVFGFEMVKLLVIVMFYDNIYLHQITFFQNRS